MPNVLRTKRFLMTATGAHDCSYQWLWDGPPASAAIVKPALSASAQHEALPRPLRVSMACRIEGAAAQTD